MATLLSCCVTEKSGRRLVAANCPAGKFLGTTTPWAIKTISTDGYTIGSSYCTLSPGSSADEYCIQDTSGDYGKNEKCTFTHNGIGSRVTRQEWGMIEGRGTYLNVGASSFCGEIGYWSRYGCNGFPASMQVSGTTTFEYNSGDSNCSEYMRSRWGTSYCIGFKLCSIVPVSCALCPLGKYQPSNASVSCLQCPTSASRDETRDEMILLMILFFLVSWLVLVIFVILIYG